jgi:hypothetical protein
MFVVEFKRPRSAKVELESGENLYTIVRDPEKKLRGYQHSFNAIMDAINKDRNFRGRHWWLLPGDAVKLPALPDNPEDAVRAGTRNTHYFQIHSEPQIIDVYIGFMDEEVNSRLHNLVQKEAAKRANQQRPVILIERGKVDPGGPILEWRIGNYDIGGKATPVRKIQRVSTQGDLDTWVAKQGQWKQKSEPIDMPTNLFFLSNLFRQYRLRKWADKQKESIEPEDIIARALGVFMQSDIGSDLTWLARGLKVKKYFDIVKLLQHRGKLSTKSKLPADATGGGPWLSVVRFDVGEHNLLAPIVVIRSPEMGLQPSLMCPYLAFLFKALSAASSQFAAIEAEQRKVIVHAKGGWEKSENTDKQDLWEDVEGNAQIYPSGKKLKKWPIWEWPLRVSQFGGQGSTSAQRSFRPGSIDTVFASLLVGFEVSSDIGLTATSPSKTEQFGFQHSEDSTEDEPAWVMPDRMLRSEQHVPSRPAPPAFKKADVSSDSTSSHVYAVISLCTPGGIYDFLREEVPGNERVDIKSKIEAANTRAQYVFWNQTLTVRTNADASRLDEHGPFYRFERRFIPEGRQITLAALINKVKETYAGTTFKRQQDRRPEVTLTVTYFGGENDKKAADELGIKGVAMEDYHVLRVLRSAVADGILEDSAYPIILDWRVDRINCDPKLLPRNVERDFNDFYRIREVRGPERQSILTVDDYVKIIIWGLRGLRQEDITANDTLRQCLNWKYVRTIDSASRPAYFWSFIGDVGGDDFFVPDPFCVEIATDFVKELAEMDPQDRHAGIADLTGGEKQEAKKLAEAVLQAWRREDKQGSTWLNVYSSPSAEGTKARIIKLMGHLRDKCGFGVAGAGHEYVLTWLRPGSKWEGVGNIATLQEAANRDKFKAAAIDRAFYKSSNMMALQTFAAHGLWS